MSLPVFLREVAGGIQLSVKVQPRASRNEVGGVMGGELRVRVTAPPVDDAANAAVVELLAEVIGCSRGAVQLVRGRSSRHKVIQIVGMSAAAVADRLE